MGRIGRTVRVNRIVGIAVVCDDDHLVTVSLGSLYHFAGTLVHRLDRFGYRIVHARMAHHVAIGEIEGDEIETPRR